MSTQRNDPDDRTQPAELEQSIVLAGGCFWCIEAVYQRIAGVSTIAPGYAGGSVPNPTYEAVCTGTTGHAEVACITFDPAITSLDELLEVFWSAHDPTTLNRQGADVGTQYRSAVFYASEDQHQAAVRSKSAAQAQLGRPIVTEIVALATFYAAENYHHNYFNNHPMHGYCRAVIEPKLRKLGLPIR